jgi:hypothetical protein
MLRSDAGTEHRSEHPWSSIGSTGRLRERTQDTRPFGRANVGVGGRVYWDGRKILNEMLERGGVGSP